MHLPTIFLSILVNLIVCRDFYVGMFKRNDFLVAQDRLYKEKEYNRKVIAKYGRIFKCPITYIRIVDRLGIRGRGPTAEILRGGLLRNFVVLRLQSAYNYPISVNIYVGCENKMAREQTLPTTDKKITDKAEAVTSAITSNTDTSSTDSSVVNKTVSDIDVTTANSTIADNSTSGNKTM